ncbi:MAG: NADP-dependent oxidoreductase [Acidobacteria bacterium]|jgi:hypothetical protein|nr:NADP-dependent oxidoreductase [Acidobacteriota bacterium]
MTERINKRWRLAAYPEGMVDESAFQYMEAPVLPPGDGQVLVKVIWLSVDPYVRGRMSPVKSYVEPMKVGQTIAGQSVGQVLESRHPRFDKGDLVLGFTGWQSYAVMPGEELEKVALRALKASYALGVLGMPGLTAYFGLLEVGKAREGETVLVSGAAGAVGSTAGQIAKIKGCMVVGVAGSDEKARWLTEGLGFDAAVNYKAHPDLREALGAACPNGVDVYFDNVGGTVSDAAIGLINQKARIVVCGQIAHYNAKNPPRGPRILATLLVNRARAEGFIVYDFQQRFPTAMVELQRWMAEGRLKARETIIEGIENAPKAFLGLFEGANTGKLLVKVGEME